MNGPTGGDTGHLRIPVKEWGAASGGRRLIERGSASGGVGGCEGEGWGRGGWGRGGAAVGGGGWGIVLRSGAAITIALRSGATIAKFREGSRGLCTVV